VPNAKQRKGCLTESSVPSPSRETLTANNAPARDRRQVSSTSYAEIGNRHPNRRGTGRPIDVVQRHTHKEDTVAPENSIRSFARCLYFEANGTARRCRRGAAGFDQDEAESKRDERAVILRRLLASKCDTLEALELADRLFDACPCLVEIRPRPLPETRV
jgi:hypothetical protein